MNRTKNIGKRRFKLGSQLLVDNLLNKQLEKYNVTIDDLPKLKEDGVFGEKEWFEYYKFTTEREYQNWANYCVKVLTENTYPRLNKKEAIRQFQWLNMGFGLKQDYKLNNEDNVEKKSDIIKESEILGSAGGEISATTNESVGNSETSS